MDDTKNRMRFNPSGLKPINRFKIDDFPENKILWVLSPMKEGKKYYSKNPSSSEGNIKSTKIE